MWPPIFDPFWAKMCFVPEMSQFWAHFCPKMVQLHAWEIRPLSKIGQILVNFWGRGTDRPKRVPMDPFWPARHLTKLTNFWKISRKIFPPIFGKIPQSEAFSEENDLQKLRPFQKWPIRLFLAPPQRGNYQFGSYLVGVGKIDFCRFFR